MTLGLSPEQQDLSDAVGQFAGRHAPIAATRDMFAELAAGHLPGWWDALVDNGFHAVHMPERLGGQGGELIDAACVLEAAGKALLPGPLLPTVAAGAVALLAEPTPAAEALLRGLAAGGTAAVVLPGDGDLVARADGQRWLLTGASEVTAGVCSARTILARRPDPARRGPLGGGRHRKAHGDNRAHHPGPTWSPMPGCCGSPTTMRATRKR